uniref:7TM_GPCR_Srx domain-containing protein n=1 Tax=Caenorhabditis tropicalis TaxID=1561998 RepID=A0A1I7T0Y6_9PELO
MSSEFQVITGMNRFTELGLSVIFQCTIGYSLEVTSKVKAITETGLSVAKNYPSDIQTHQRTWNFSTLRGALNGFTWFFRT